MMKQQFNCMDAALQLAGKGIKVYPTVAGKKMPFKGSHAQKDATSNQEKVFELFSAHPGADVSIKLDNIIVLDVDNHTGEQEGLTALSKAGFSVSTSTRIEKTPSNGAHIFFRYSGVPFNHLDLMPGVEVRGDQIKVSPSKGYELINAGPTVEAPEWLLGLIEQARKPKTSHYNRIPGQETFVGKTINSLMDGAAVGQRNTWLAERIGFILGQGVEPSNAYKLMWWITQTALQDEHKPIKKSEFDNTFKSIYQREQAKLGGGVLG